MVTVTLLVVIILGLTAMFNQTRKAFTIGLSNVDYQDAGRTAMDLIARDLEQMVPSDYSTYDFYAAAKSPGSYSYANGLNFYADVSPGFNYVAWSTPSGDATNFSLERLYFVTRYNQQLNAVGYRLVPSDVANGVGTLYRFSTNAVPVSSLAAFGYQINNFITDPPALPASFSRVVDGVVDFRIRTYDRNGLLIPTVSTPLYGGFVSNAANLTTGVANFDPAAPFTSTNIYYSREYTGDYLYGFYTNAIPAYVEIELGILESPTLAQLQALTNSAGTLGSPYWQYLTNHTGQVHIFRQRVTIPAADPAAYP